MTCCVSVPTPAQREGDASRRAQTVIASWCFTSKQVRRQSWRSCRRTGPLSGFHPAGSSSFQTGLRGPAGIHLRSPDRVLILRRFQAILGGVRTWVDSQKNRPDASEVARCAPPQHTKHTERKSKNNGLAFCGESFSSQPHTTCTEKTVAKRLSEKVLHGASGGQMPLAQTCVLTLPDHHWTPTEFRTGPRGPPEYPARDQHGFDLAHHPEYTDIHSAQEAIRLAVRCLARNCLIPSEVRVGCVCRTDNV